jgi:hypothetical protein
LPNEIVDSAALPGPNPPISSACHVVPAIARGPLSKSGRSSKSLMLSQPPASRPTKPTTTVVRNSFRAEQSDLYRFKCVITITH